MSATVLRNFPDLNKLLKYISVGQGETQYSCQTVAALSWKKSHTVRLKKHLEETVSLVCLQL